MGGYSVLFVFFIAHFLAFFLFISLSLITWITGFQSNGYKIIVV